MVIMILIISLWMGHIYILEFQKVSVWDQDQTNTTRAILNSTQSYFENVTKIYENKKSNSLNNCNYHLSCNL